jgi:hypothetical protein
MAAYNPRNFDLGQFMNDLFLQPDLSAQFQFLGNHLQVVNAYASAMEQELTRVTAIATTAQAQSQSSTRNPRSSTNQWDLKESRSICRSGQLQWRDQPL